jgi:Imm-5 like putative immunity protein
MFVALFGILVMIAGGVLGYRMFEGAGPWLQVGATVAGGVLGLVMPGLALGLISLPFLVAAGLLRVMQPAELVCHCNDSSDRTTGIPDHLLATSPVAVQAVWESYRLMMWPEFARLHPSPGWTRDTLRTRLAAGSLSEERVALAAELRDATAEGVAAELRTSGQPLSAGITTNLNKALPNVLQQAPPRLCTLWALACAGRVLPVFEAEFHQDTRPRQAFGAALLLLRDGNIDALELARTEAFVRWTSKDAGCRVLHRSAMERFLGNASLGEKAARAVFQVGRMVANYVEPIDLWTSHPTADLARSYATPRARCTLSEPARNARAVAYSASQAAPNSKLEMEWQTEELVRLILGWERWNEDHEAWRIRVEEEWIPRVEEELTSVHFDVAAYTTEIRKRLLPGSQGGSR